MAFAFSAILPLVTVSAKALIPAPREATRIMGILGTSLFILSIGEGKPVPQELAALALFLAAGLSIDRFLSPPREARWPLVALLSAGVGLLSFVLLQLPMEEMTGGLGANPPLFLATYALGGLVGGLGAVYGPAWLRTRVRTPEVRAPSGGRT